MNKKFEDSVQSHVDILNSGKPLEAFDIYFSTDGVMFSNGTLFAKDAREAREKQEPYFRAAALISGLVTDLKTHAPTQTCVFRNKSFFRTHDGLEHHINGLCWQLWEEGRIVEERYFDGDAMLEVIAKGVMSSPEMLVQGSEEL